MRQARTTGPAIQVREVHIPMRRTLVRAYLSVPARAVGVVVIAHDRGKPRVAQDRRLGQVLGHASIGSLCIDPLELPAARPGDLTLLQERFDLASSWLERLDAGRGLPIGHFGSGLAAVAACIGPGVRHRRLVATVACDGEWGRPYPCPRSSVPTMLVASGLDDRLLELNCDAYATLPAPRRLEVVPGTACAFDEPWAIDSVACWAADWFTSFMRSPRARLLQQSGRFPAFAPPPAGEATEGRQAQRWLHRVDVGSPRPAVDERRPPPAYSLPRPS